MSRRRTAGGLSGARVGAGLPRRHQHHPTTGTAARLSNAALEVLAVVAYRQPVTLGQISELRGVDSASALRTLNRRGLVEPAGRLPTPGNPALYSTTKAFMEALGLGSLSELPPLAEHMPPPGVAETLDRPSTFSGDPNDRP